MRPRAKPQAILAIATATSEGIRKVAEAIQDPGGYEAVQLRVAEQYIGEFGELAKGQQYAGAPRIRLRRGIDDRFSHECDQ